jgi:cell wall-associated NlpC family hydrolase
MNLKTKSLIVGLIALGLPITLASPADAATIGQRALVVASNQKNDPYRYGATGPNAFDCSGLAQYAFKSVGKQLPRTAAQQYTATARVPASQRQPGDLVFIGSPVYHVGVYAGNGRMWNANTGSYRGRRVVLAPISEYGGTVRYGRVR